MEEIKKESKCKRLEKRAKMPDDVRIFWNRFDDIRIRLGHTNAEINHDCDFRSNRIDSLKTKGLFPSVPDLLAIARYFNCSVDTLLGTEKYNESVRGTAAELTEAILNADPVTQKCIMKILDMKV